MNRILFLYIFRPVIVLPSPDQYTIAVRCCPLLFQLHAHSEDKPPIITLPYRMIFAVATKSSVYLYDTQQPMPFGIISNIHYTRLTDLAWSSDGRILIVSSTDGFCTLITFSANELGTIYKPPTTETDLPADAKDEALLISSDDDSRTSTLTATQNSPKIIDAEKKVPEKTTVKRITVDTKTAVDSSNESASAEKKPTPIAFRRTKLQDTTNKNSEINSTTQPQKTENNLTVDKANGENDAKPTPIAFRRKPRTPSTPLTPKTNINEQKNVNEITPENTKCTDETAPAELVIAMEIPPSIISSQEKFDSPEILSHKPATPIQVRREPRNPQTPTTGAIQAKITSNMSPNQLKSGDKISESTFTPPKSDLVNTPPKSDVVLSNSKKSTLSKKKTIKTPKLAKKATPIAIRRHQRNILPTVPTVDRSATEDEALDAWPIDQPKPNTVITINDEDQSQVNNDIKTNATASLLVAEDRKLPNDDATYIMEVDESEDIRLVYDDSQAAIDENNLTEIKTMAEADAGTEQQLLKSPLKENCASDQLLTPNSKTPRRVELRTLSTPKSKKKLL